MTMSESSHRDVVVLVVYYRPPSEIIRVDMDGFTGSVIETRRPEAEDSASRHVPFKKRIVGLCRIGKFKFDSAFVGSIDRTYESFRHFSVSFLRWTAVFLAITSVRRGKAFLKGGRR